LTERVGVVAHGAVEEFVEGGERLRPLHEFGDRRGLVLVHPGCHVDDDEPVDALGVFGGQSDGGKTAERHARDRSAGGRHDVEDLGHRLGIADRPVVLILAPVRPTVPR
jgi:hypothetical protein